MEQQNEHITPQAEEASFGGYHYRLEYEQKQHSRHTRFWENVIVSVGFGAVVIAVTMMLVAVGASL